MLSLVEKFGLTQGIYHLLILKKKAKTGKAMKI